MNPTRSARPPEKFALENFAFSATKLTEELDSFRRRKTISGVVIDYYARGSQTRVFHYGWAVCGAVVSQQTSALENLSSHHVPVCWEDAWAKLHITFESLV